MKILIISNGNFFSMYGGGQVYVKNIVEELINQGCNIVILSFMNDIVNIQSKSYHGCNLYEAGKADYGQLVSLLTNIAPDIVHAHSQKALIASIGKELNIPVVITAHHGGILCPAGTLMNQNDEICQVSHSHEHCLSCCLNNIRSGKYWYPIMKQFKKNQYIKLGNYLQSKPFIPFITPIGQAALQIVRKENEWKEIIANCNRMIAPSNAIAQSMIRNGFPKDKISVIPHGIPLPENRPSFSAPEMGIKFFFVGRICYVKGIHILLQAFHELSHPNAELHLIGGVGNKNEERYMQKLQRKYANPNMVWHGRVAPEVVLEKIKDYHILIHPTICLEVFGLNISEALAMGKPVLATRCGGAEMQIQEGINGWLVEPNKIQALKQKIESILMSPNQLCFNNSKVISITEHCKTLLNLYEKTAH